LFWANEILGLRLMTWHNLHLYLSTLRRAREAIDAGGFEEFRREFVANYSQGCHSERSEESQ
jgi:queuine tRNA-ribosyltransferase